MRRYTSLSRALRGIRQGLDPDPPGRGRAGASLFRAFGCEVTGEVHVVCLGHAAWGGEPYWLDLTDAGRRLGLDRHQLG